MRKYGKKVRSEGGFSIVEVLSENGDIIGYVVLSPNGDEVFCTSFEQALSLFNMNTSNEPEPEPDNSPSFG